MADGASRTLDGRLADGLDELDRCDRRQGRDPGQGWDGSWKDRQACFPRTCREIGGGEWTMNPIPSIDYIRILPEIILTVFGTIVMMADPLFEDHNDRKALGVL